MSGPSKAFGTYKPNKVFTAYYLRADTRPPVTTRYFGLAADVRIQAIPAVGLPLSALVDRVSLVKGVPGDIRFRAPSRYPCGRLLERWAVANLSENY